MRAVLGPIDTASINTLGLPITTAKNDHRTCLHSSFPASSLNSVPQPQLIHLCIAEPEVPSTQLGRFPYPTRHLS